MNERRMEYAPTERRIVALVDEDLGWGVSNIEPIPHGSEALYVIEPDGPDAPDRVVLKYCIAEDRSRFPIEPKLLQFIAANTSVPVPTVYATGKDGDFPYMFVEYCDGLDVDGDVSIFEPETQRRLAEEAGSHLAEIHASRTFDQHGVLTVEDDEVVIQRAFETTSDFLLSYLDIVLELEVPDEFADLDLRGPAERAARSVPQMTPVLVHSDYGLHNISVGRDHTTNAVLDWGGAKAAPAEFDLVRAEEMLCLHCPLDSPMRERVREGLLSGYGDVPQTYFEWRDEIAFVNRMGPMYLLDAWFQDEPESVRAKKAAIHREATQQFLDSRSG